MSRTVSLDARAGMFSEESEIFPIILLTLQHPDFAGVQRLCTAGNERISETPLVYGLTSRGNQFIYLPLTAQLPDDVDERAPSARFIVENVDRSLIPFVRSVITPGTVDIEIIMSNDLDTVEIDYPTLDMRSCQFNAGQLTMEVGLDALESEPYPAGSFSPSGFPGLF